MTTDEGLPRPDIDLAEAERLARDLFAVTGTVRELGSQQDRNILVSTGDGRVLLKVSNRAFSRAEVEAQNAVMRHLDAAGIDVPVPIASIDGDDIAVREIGGEPHHVRLLSFVEGDPLIDRAVLSPADAAALGDLAGRTVVVLADVEHPGLERGLQWDLRQGEDVVRALLHHVPDDGRRQRVAAALEAVAEALGPVRDDLRLQTVHGDLTDDNVVTRASRGVHDLAGIIDFGDAMTSWRVAELAVACTAVLHREPNDPFTALALIAAFDRRVPLDDAEITALWPLVILRGAVLVVSGLQQVSIDPTNDYASEALEREWSIFATAASLPLDVAERAVRLALGRPTTAFDPSTDAHAFPAVQTAPVDLSWSSDILRDGDWLTGDPERREAEAADAVRPPTGVSITRFGEARLTRSALHSPAPPANVALGVELFPESPVLVSAPFDGVIERTPSGRIVLAGADVALVIDHLDDAAPAGSRLRVGDPLGSVGNRTTVWATRPDVAQDEHDLVTTRARFDALRSRYADPTPYLFGGAVAHPAAAPSTDLLSRRSRSYSPIQGHYYAEPPRIERGWREHLIDVDGRHYLDMVNNVTVLGHGHPAVAQAAERQWRLLNTNSRFHYASVAELSERLLATLPDSFDTVLLVNSGTESVDLALRLARAFSGRPDVACVAESYHGWSLAADAVSTSTSDNPRAAETRPPWVHVLDAPNAYRGVHRGDDAGTAYADDAREQFDALRAAGTPIGTFIAEPRNGNAGGIAVPPGYLAAVTEAVRACGGVTISDEVQVGYGRQGSVFWGFEDHGVVPDIVTVAKAMGNGHPLGAVITRSDIVAALADQGTVFSSSGGSTLSSRIGVTVLDVLRDEDLQGNALRTGGRLRDALVALAERHPLVGTVHGQGLYLGVELVRDHDTLEPATEETRLICDRMLDLGVIVQPTGDRGNVLKVKPPLCFSEASADVFVSTLDRALTELR